MKKSSVYILLILFVSCGIDSEPVISILTNNPKLRRAENTVYYDGKRFTGVVRTSIDDKLNELFMEVKNGLMDGKYQEWNSDHIIQSDRRYKKGVEHGLQKGFHHDGTLSYEYNCYEGERVGDYKEYYPNGNLHIYKYLEDGKEIKTKINDLEGKVIANYVLKDGRYYGLMGSSSCYSVLDAEKQ